MTISPPKIEFIVPVRVKSRSNARGHWTGRHRTAKTERKAARLLAEFFRRAARFKPPFRVRLTRVAPRPLDDDNVRDALKAIRDGIADAYGVDDSARTAWRWEYAQRRGAPREYAVVVEIERLHAMQDT